MQLRSTHQQANVPLTRPFPHTSSSAARRARDRLDPSASRRSERCSRRPRTYGRRSASDTTGTAQAALHRRHPARTARSRARTSARRAAPGCAPPTHARQNGNSCMGDPFASSPFPPRDLFSQRRRASTTAAAQQRHSTIRSAPRGAQRYCPAARGAPAPSSGRYRPLTRQSAQASSPTSAAAAHPGGRLRT